MRRTGERRTTRLPIAPGPTETKITRLPYTYEVTLEPACVAVGQDFTLTFHLEPGAAVAGIAIHADGETHETRWGKNAGPDGIAVHTWTAPPAPGPGRMLTGASAGGGRSGGTEVAFRIVEIPGTC